eukprot:9810258-Alexandrium_andersonii.AAC.1
MARLESVPPDPSGRPVSPGCRRSRLGALAHGLHERKSPGPRSGVGGRTGARGAAGIGCGRRLADR